MTNSQPAPDADDDIAVEGLDDETNPAPAGPMARSSSAPEKSRNIALPQKRTTLKPHKRGIPQVPPVSLSGGKRGTRAGLTPKELTNQRGALKMCKALFVKAVQAGDLWLAHEITKTIQGYLIGGKGARLSDGSLNTGGIDASEADPLPDDADFEGDDEASSDDETEQGETAPPMHRATEQRSVEDKDKQSAAERERRNRDA